VRAQDLVKCSLHTAQHSTARGGSVWLQWEIGACLEACQLAAAC
jgi:hypothetical protein